jgi:uncharacterized membrane protein
MRTSRWIAAAVAVATVGWFAAVKAQSTVPQSLVFASYDSENGARDALKAMKQTQREGVIHIDSFAVVSKDMKGHVHVQSTQKRGATAGAVVGALVGVLGGPVGAAVGATAGGALGYLTGEAVGIPREDINAIKSSLAPGTSAIVAVVDERWLADLERSLHEAQAKQVLDHKIGGVTAAPEITAPPANPTPGANLPSPKAPDTNVPPPSP